MMMETFEEQLGFNERQEEVPSILTVTELNNYIKVMFEKDPFFSSIMVRGELSNFTNHYKSGHMYMSIKDEGSIIRAVMFAGNAKKLKFVPESGMKVIVTARVAAFPRDGQYQLYLSDMQPDGIGALHVAFEQLKEKLAAEGLFDDSRKRPLPRMPMTIGVITSPTGAAVRDIINVLGRRYPLGVVKLCPVLVQGDSAAPQLVKAIRMFNKRGLADVIIIGRGGGSIEELWAFNEEIVARAVAESEIPIVSAVGHETDFTICDFAADLRAPTPSAAAELVSPNISELRTFLLGYRTRVQNALLGEIKAYRAKVQTIQKSRALQSPKNLLEDKQMQLAFVTQGMLSSMERIIALNKHRFVATAAKLDALSPLAVLGRGYLIAKKENKVIDSIKNLQRGDSITLNLCDGEAECCVTELHSAKLAE